MFPQTPCVKPPAQPASPPGADAPSARQTDLSGAASGPRGAQSHPPYQSQHRSAGSGRWNICKVVWRWKKIIHCTLEIAHLHFAAIATFLALNQILLQEANSIALSQVLLFMSLAINWGMDGGKAPKVAGIRTCLCGLEEIER